MKVFAVPPRPAPPGWVSALWCEEVIGHLATGRVTDLALAMDLSDDGTGEGVLRWIEEAVAMRGFRPPAIFVTAVDGCAREQMARIVQSIERLSRAVSPPESTG